VTRIISVCAALLAAAGAAAAQPAQSPPRAPTSPEAVVQFVDNFVTPTHTTGKVARWEEGICPLTVGQQPAVTKFVSDRVKQIAALVGAPVNSSATCTPNIEIVFSRVPQELLDNIHARQPDYLGYAESGADIKKLATMTKPIQAWYETQTVDLRGMGRIDSARPQENPNGVHVARSTGNHLTDGVRSTFAHIVIVADVTKLAGYEAGPLADYITMLALTQINSLDTCQPLFSIENMLAKGCEAKNGKLTDNDIAYLRGVYKMAGDKKLLANQQNEIASVMQKVLDGP